jgi:hypothetical protein
MAAAEIGEVAGDRLDQRQSQNCLGKLSDTRVQRNVRGVV